MEISKYTRLINADVPQHVVKQLMDHTSDLMTAHYARIGKQTVRQHWDQAQRVNIRSPPNRTRGTPMRCG